jgi:rSAM/selenodomain-associated transferase 2
VEGVVREVVIVDGGSTDRTLHIADAAGAAIVKASAGRGGQLIAGAKTARFPWLLFLHADTLLEPTWSREAAQFIERQDGGQHPIGAAAFRFALDDQGTRPRLVEAGVGLRATLLKLPYGDQGLLIPRALYDEIGGYRALPLMEDVDIIRRLGRRRVTILRTAAVTSASRYRRDGYVTRIARNVSCLVLYSAGVPMRIIKRIYG